MALSLANLGVDASFFTVVPGNSLGKSAVRMLRSNDVNCDSVVYSTEEETPTHRLGTYYLETGYGIRPSKVVYDRKHSAFSEYDFSKTDVKKLLEGYTWLHLSGITPALGKSCSELILTCLKTAKENGMTVSFDGNFRSTLWSWEEARDFCTLCLPYVDVLFGIEPYHIWKNEEDHTAGDVKDGVPFQPDREQQEKVFKAFVERYPNIKCIARHVRFAHSCSENSLMAYLWLNGKIYESNRLTLHILDRVGKGYCIFCIFQHNYRNNTKLLKHFCYIHHLNFLSLSFYIKIHFHHMSDQRNIICNISVTMNGMLHCTGCNTKVYNIIWCIFIHQCINNTTYKCISTANTIKNMEGKPVAFVNLSV